MKDSDAPVVDLGRRRVLIGGGLLLTAAATAARMPRDEINFLGSGKLEALIPTRIGQWSFASESGIVVPPDDEMVDELYAQLVTRVYTAPGLATIMLLVAQGGGQTGVLQVHRPEVCYPAGGFALSERRVFDVELPGGTLPTNAFTATADARIEQLLYWTRVGNDLPSSWLAQRWSVARANLEGYIPDAVLVRLSTITPDRNAAFADLAEFGRALLASTSPSTRRFLIGPALG